MPKPDSLILAREVASNSVDSATLVKDLFLAGFDVIHEARDNVRFKMGREHFVATRTDGVFEILEDVA